MKKIKDLIPKKKLVRNPFDNKVYEIKSTTPGDLLAAYGMKRTKVEGTGEVYKKGMYVCDQCDFQADVLLGRDETVYHECNYGHVVFHVNKNK